MENDDDVIHELSLEDEVSSTQKKRSGMVIKTSAADKVPSDDEDEEDRPSIGAQKKKLLELKAKVTEAFEKLNSRQEEIETHEKEAKKREQELGKREKTFKEMEKELDDKQKEHERLERGLQEKEEALDQLKEELNARGNELGEREKEIDAREKEFKERAQELDEKGRKVEEFLRQTTEKEKSVQEKEQFLLLGKKELEERDAQIEESKSYLKAELERITAEKNGIENENRRLKKEKNELQEEKNELQREKKMFEHKIEVLKKKEANLLEKEKVIERTLQKMRKGEDRESKLLKEIEKREEKLREETASCERLKDELENEKEALEKAKEELETTKQRLKEEEEGLKERTAQQEEEYHKRFYQLEKEAPVASLHQAPKQEEMGFKEEFSEILDELKSEHEEEKNPEELFEGLEELEEAEEKTPTASSSVMDDIGEISDFIEREKAEGEEEELSAEVEIEDVVDGTDVGDEILEAEDAGGGVSESIESAKTEELAEEDALLKELEDISTSGRNINDNLTSTEMSSENMAAQNLSPEEQAKKIQQYRSIIGHFKEKGYNVITVVRAFERNDFKLIRERMLDFMEKVQKLKEVEKELGTINIEGIRDTIHVIRSKLKDPEAIHRIEKTMAAVRKKVEEKDKKKCEEKMKELNKVKELFKSLEEKYDLGDYEEEIYDIRSKLGNPELLSILDLSKLSTHIKQLENTIAQKEQNKKEKRLRETIKLEIQEFKKKGYRVKPLEEALSKDLQSAEKLYLDYITNIDRLEELRRELDDMNTMDFEKERKNLEERMNNPAKIDAVEDGLSSLKRKVRLKRIKAMDLTLHEKEDKGAAPVSFNLGGESSGPGDLAADVKLESPLEKPISKVKPEPKPRPPVDPLEKPRVKVCPNCKKGRIVIPPKVRPIRVNCQSCGKEFLITGDSASKRPAPQEKPHPFDGQDYVEEKTTAGATSSPETQAIEEGKCPSCGAELIEGSDFCGFCGYKVK